MSASLDIAANRTAPKWTRKELAGRALWGLMQPLFRWSPRTCRGWRRFLLRLYGAKIGKQVHIEPTVIIAVPWKLEIGDWSAVGQGAILYSLGKITIGHSATVSQFAHLCAGSHDHRDPALPLLKLPIVIGDQAWICADAFIGPNVNVGEGAIVGARAVAIKDVPPWKIVVGNPAQIIKDRKLR